MNRATWSVGAPHWGQAVGEARRSGQVPAGPRRPIAQLEGDRRRQLRVAPGHQVVLIHPAGRLDPDPHVRRVRVAHPVDDDSARVDHLDPLRVGEPAPASDGDWCPAIRTSSPISMSTSRCGFIEPGIEQVHTDPAAQRTHHLRRRR